MSKLTRLKPEKSKVKLVFRLQFHATNIPQPGWDKLFVSFIPVDSGKVSAKTTKANVKNGVCKWSDPIYETANILQNAKSKKFEEKFYKLVVEMGSARSNVLGETTINLAEYVDSWKPSSVALPLEGCGSESIFHATVQLLTSKTGFREFEKQRELRERGFRSVTQPTVNDPVEKVKFKSDYADLSSLGEEREISNEDYTDSAVGIDGSSYTSGSLHIDRHDISMNYEVESLKSTMSGDVIGFSLDPVHRLVKENISESRTLIKGSHDWVHGWTSDYSIDNYMSTVSEDNNRYSSNLEISEASIQDLKLELKSLQSHTDIVSVETQKFGLVLASEIASSEKLASEVSILKAECSKLKNEVQNLSSSEEVTYRINRGLHPDDSLAGNIVSEKVSTLLCELEESKLERETVIKKMNQMECYYEALLQEVEMNQKQLVDELQVLSNEHSTCHYRISSSEAQLEKVHVEMREQHLRFIRERQELDILNKKLEKKAASAEVALKKHRLNYSVVVDQLQKDLELLSFQVISMFETNENLAKQAFKESENSLLDFMQEEFQEGMSDEHFTPRVCDSEAMELRKSAKDCLFGLGVHLNSSKDILVSKLHNEVNTMQNWDEETLSKKIERSVWLQEELLRKAESELSDLYIDNLHLGVFSIVLQQSLCQAFGEMNVMEGKIKRLSQLLEQSTEGQELLYLKLQSSLGDIDKLRESETRNLTQSKILVSQNHILEEKFQNAMDENCHLAKKLFDSHEIIADHEARAEEHEIAGKEMRTRLEESNFEKMKFELELGSLHTETSAMKEELLKLTADKINAEISALNLENNMRSLLSNMVLYCDKFNGPEIPSLQLEFMDSAGIASQLECIQKGVCEQLLRISQDKIVVEKERDNTQMTLDNSRSEVLLQQQRYDSLLQDLSTKLELARLEAKQHGLEVQALVDKLTIVSEAEERHALKNEQTESKLAELENDLMYHMDENNNLKKQIQNFEGIICQYEKAKLSLLDDVKALEAEKIDSSQLTSELFSLKDNMRLINNELLAEKNLRSIMELKGKDLMSEINDRQQCIDAQNAELLQLNQKVRDIESRNLQLKIQSEKSQISQMEYVTTTSTNISDLENSFFTLYEHHMTSEIELLVTKEYFFVEMLELNKRIESLNEEIQFKHLDVTNTVANFRSLEELNIKGNSRFSTMLESPETQLHEAASEKSELELPDEGEGEVGDFQKKQTEDAVIEQLENELLNVETELEYMKSSRDELDIEVVVLRSKLSEQLTQISLMQELHDKMSILQEEHNVLIYKLSEQILKTEEFKNLSIHLRELKDKAEAECSQAREKVDNVSVAQESLRIAFIREQCESKVQELRSQLYASKRHGEEMLLKLQNAVDEIESRKKCEAALAKRNEELIEKILNLDKDLHKAIAENREKANTFDRLNAQLECSTISLECCKEEKMTLESSLTQCFEEKSKLANELSLLKGVLESPISLNGNKELQDNGIDPFLIPADNRSIQPSQKIPEDALHNGLAISVDVLRKQDGAFENSLKSITQINEKFREGSLKPSIDSIQRELERLKVENSNSLLPCDAYDNEPCSSDVQELARLDMVNERLGNLFPSYKELSGSRNAVEKVLALEMELAEALELRKESNDHFRSTLLKQHKDDEALFQSIRDVNELIKDMLEMKRRHETMDSELKEMHGRYSELSLRFAEVEGERQKLMMIVKNIKLPKRQ